MKIISPGLMDKEGIFVTCQKCHCVYLIEDRNDWCGEWVKNIIPGNDKRWHYVKTYYYTSKCPSCFYEEHFEAIDCNRKYNWLTSRSDWEERYMMKNE